MDSCIRNNVSSQGQLIATVSAATELIQIEGGMCSFILFIGQLALPVADGAMQHAAHHSVCDTSALERCDPGISTVDLA